LIPDLLQAGYGVLAPDLRSFGESTVVVRDGTEETYELKVGFGDLWHVVYAFVYRTSIRF
jgi:hypothetical protein